MGIPAGGKWDTNGMGIPTGGNGILMGRTNGINVLSAPRRARYPV